MEMVLVQQAKKEKGKSANGRHEVRKGKEVGMKEMNESETNSKNKGKKGERGKWLSMRQEEGGT